MPRVGQRRGGAPLDVDSPQTDVRGVLPGRAYPRAAEIHLGFLGPGEWDLARRSGADFARTQTSQRSPGRGEQRWRVPLCIVSRLLLFWPSAQKRPAGNRRVSSAVRRAGRAPTDWHRGRALGRGDFLPAYQPHLPVISRPLGKGARPSGPPAKWGP